MHLRKAHYLSKITEDASSFVLSYTATSVCWALRGTQALAFKWDLLQPHLWLTHPLQSTVTRKRSSQFVKTNARPKAKKRASFLLWLLCAPGEEMSGAVCFQHASAHYHPHSSRAWKTMALNIHGNPLSSKGPPSQHIIDAIRALLHAHIFLNEITENISPMCFFQPTSSFDYCWCTVWMSFSSVGGKTAASHSITIQTFFAHVDLTYHLRLPQSTLLKIKFLEIWREKRYIQLCPTVMELSLTEPESHAISQSAGLILMKPQSYVPFEISHLQNYSYLSC